MCRFPQQQEWGLHIHLSMPGVSENMSLPIQVVISRFQHTCHLQLLLYAPLVCVIVCVTYRTVESLQHLASARLAFAALW